MTRKRLEQLMATLPALPNLQWDRETKELVELARAPDAFVRDGVLVVSAENGDGAADFYGEFRGGHPWINPLLEKWAANHGGHWEWESPGAISFCPN